MKILLTGAFSYTENQLEILQNMGLDIDFLQYEKDKLDNCEIYDAVVCNGLFLYNDIEKFKNLKYIQLTSAGFDRVPMDYVKNNNIKIYNAAGVYSIPIAEHTVLKVLEIYKKSKDFYIKQKNHLWEKEREIFELYGKNVLIVGCGNIGKEIAKRFKAFGTNIKAVDIAPVNCEYIDSYEHINNLTSAIENSDIVILTLPLTDETKGIINKNCFDVMKKSSILVNISRGQVINEADLVDALENKQIYGAALDVFQDEPLSENSKLWDFENVLVTPHNAFVGEGNSERMFDVLCNNLKVFIGGIQ